MGVSKKKILVHVCCAACASHVFSELDKAGFVPVAYFFNPFLYEEEEYSRRLSDLEKFCTNESIELIFEKFDPEEFYDLLIPFIDKKSIKFISDKDRYRRRRCEICNRLVLEKTQKMARKKHLRAFTTTLLCSPYKNHDELKSIGERENKEAPNFFYYSDFRKGYWKGRNFAKNNDIFIPSYCGCFDSKKERRLE